MRPLPRTFVIRRAAQVAALGSSVRWQVVDSLSAYGASSIRQLGARLGRAPASLYYHVRRLVEVGIVVVAGKQRARRRSEAVYRLAAPRLVIDPQQRSGPFREALADTGAALLRLTIRDYRAAVQRGDTGGAGPLRDLMVRRYTAHFDRAGLRELQRLSHDLAALVEQYQEPGVGHAYALTLTLTPLPGSVRQR